MIRFAWLRFRTQAAVALGALAILAVVLAVTGVQLAHAYDTIVAACKPHDDCASALNMFPSNGYLTLDNLLSALVLWVPGMIGMFWGAPLAAREFETGTFRLAWTQGITRTRWLAVKLGVAGAASMAVAGLLSLMVTWWSSPIEKAQMSRLGPGAFQTGIAPAGYAAFAFALGVIAGLLIRRTLPAMAVTLAVFTAVILAFPVWVRPHLIAPVQTASAVNVASLTEMGFGNNGRLVVQTQPNIPGAWILSSQIVTPAGRPASSEPATQACERNGAAQACDDYIEGLHLRETVTYQPASRYWAFQWYETGIYLAVALAMAGFCFWWIRRDHSAGLNIRRPRTSQRPLALQSSP
jgi:ABC-type transport system involved in multi-copper enzyme maturation permease subunit